MTEAFKRFIFSGIAGAIINFTTFYCLLHGTTIHYIYAAIVAFIVAFGITFLLHRYWSFKARVDSVHKQVISYFLVSICNLVLIVSILYVLAHHFGIPTFIAYIGATGSVTILSFLLNNFFVFKKTKSDDSEIWLIIGRVIIITIILFTVRNIFFTDFVSTDTMSFIETAQYYAGELPTAPGFQLLKPLPSLVLSWLHLVFDLDYMVAFKFFIFGTYIIYALSAVFFFYVFFNKEKIATYAGVILAIAAYPIVRYGLDPMVELGALAFVFVSSAYLILYNRHSSLKYLFAALASILVGFLWKEYTALTGIALFLIVLYKNYRNFAHYYKHLLAVILIPIVFLGLWHIATGAWYHYTYLDWFNVGQNNSDAYSEFTFFLVCKSFAATLFVGWIAVLYGLYHQALLTGAQKRELIVFCLVAPAVFSWGFVSSRLFFAAIIPVFALAAHGLKVVHDTYGKRVYVICLILYMLATFAVMFTTMGSIAILNK